MKMLNIILIAFILLFVDVELSHARDPLWTVQQINTPIYNVDILGQRGLSASFNSVVIWNVQTGETLDTIPIEFSKSHMMGTYFVDDSVIVVACLKYFDITVHWISLTDHTVLDSITTVARSDRANITSITLLASDVSNDRTRAVFGVNYTSSIGVRNIQDYYLYSEYNIKNRTFLRKIFVGADETLRYQTNMQVLGAIKLYKYYTAMSPTPGFGFNGRYLVELPSGKVLQQLTKNYWWPFRYTPTDRYIVAAQGNNSSVSIVDLATDSIVDDVITSFGPDHQNVYVSPLADKIVYFNGVGGVSLWTVDTSVFDTAAFVRISLPDTVEADTLYQVELIKFPFEQNRNPIIDPGDGREPFLGSFVAWHSVGTYDVQYGFKYDSDTLWSETRSVVVTEGAGNPDLLTTFKTGQDPIVYLAVKNVDSILATTSVGTVLLLNHNLELIREFKRFGNAVATTWDDDGKVIHLSKQVADTSYPYWRGPNEYDVEYHSEITFTGVQLDLVSHSSGKESYAVNDFSNDYTVPGKSYGLFSGNSTGPLWCYSALTGPIPYEYNPVSYELTSYTSAKQFTNTNYTDDSSKSPGIGFKLVYGGPVFGAVDADNKFCVVTHLASNRKAPFVFPYALVRINLQTGVAKEMSGQFNPGYYRFVGNDYLVADNIWINYPQLTPGTTHGFVSPFATDAKRNLAIAWKGGMLYAFGPDATIVSTVVSDTIRPLTMHLMDNGSIIAGYANGTIAIHKPLNNAIRRTVPDSGIGASEPWRQNANNNISNPSQKDAIGNLISALQHTEPIFIFPNPSISHVVISLRDEHTLPAPFSIVAPTGQTIFSGVLLTKAEMFTLSDLNIWVSGVYYIVVEGHSASLQVLR